MCSAPVTVTARLGHLAPQCIEAWVIRCRFCQAAAERRWTGLAGSISTTRSSTKELHHVLPKHSTAPRASHVAREGLSGFPRSRCAEQVAATLWSHLPGASDGCPGRRQVQDDVSQLLIRARSFVWRRVSGPGAQRADSLHRSVRRPEPAGRADSVGNPEASAVRHGRQHRAGRDSRGHSAGDVLPGLAGVAGPAGNAGRTRHSWQRPRLGKAPVSGGQAGCTPPKAWRVPAISALRTCADATASTHCPAPPASAPSYWARARHSGKRRIQTNRPHSTEEPVEMPRC